MKLRGFFFRILKLLERHVASVKHLQKVSMALLSL